MPKQQITTTSGASPVGAYSQGIRAGDFVYVSGQGPLDPATGARSWARRSRSRRRRTLENVKAVLEAGGAAMADVVKATVHLSDLSASSTAYQHRSTREYFPDPKPIRTTVESVLAGIMVEIDVVAYTGP